MKTLIVFMVLCLLLVGCSSSRKYWTKENYDSDQYQKDEFFCQQQGRMGAFKSDGIWYAINANQIYKQCMYSLGYYVAEEKKKGTEPKVGGTDWKAFSSVDTGMLFYNTESVVRLSSNSVRVVVKLIHNKKGVNDWVEKYGKKFENLDYSLLLNEFDCPERKMRCLSMHLYSKDGNIIDSENYDNPSWHFVNPESGVERLYKAVCK
jgi:Surface-adhesin protein E